MTLEEIKQAITGLSPEERVSLRAWLAQPDGDRPDRDGGPGSTATKLGRLSGRVVANFRKRMRET
jgi:hypothetical protein